MNRVPYLFLSTLRPRHIPSARIRGNPDKPVLMVKGSERGFGFLKNVAVNPHLSEAMRQNELVTIVDENGDVFNLRTRAKESSPLQ
jgi:hypothetical protein